MDRQHGDLIYFFSFKETHFCIFHIIFTVHSVLYNSFYFNQHMHYTLSSYITPTYVSTTY
jgi:hypothetical protein